MSSEPAAERVRTPSPLVRGTLVVLAVLVLLYSVLITTRPLLGVLLVVLIFVAYLVWRSLHLAARFVAAFERVADAMEASSKADREDRTRSPDREF